MNDDIEGATPLPVRNARHYDGRVFERVDWSQRMQRKHGISRGRGARRPGRVVIDLGYHSESARSVRIIGFSVTADDVITVIVLENDGTGYGVNGWTANEKDRRFYAAGSEGEADEQRD